MKIIKSITLGLAYLAFAFGSLKAEEPKKDSILIEETVESHDKENTFYHYLILPYARALVTDTENNDSVNYAARGNFNFGVMKGNAELIGFADSAENHGLGINARGSFNKNIGLGGALEKIVQNSSMKDMANLHTTISLSDFNYILGITNTDDITRITVGVGYNPGDNFFGLGLTRKDNDDWFATAVAGRAAKDFGYRLWGKVDANDNHMIDILASTNSTISKGTLACVIANDNGMHDPKLFPNRFDAFAFLWERTTPGGIAVNANYSEINETPSASVNAVYRFPTKISPMIGVGYKRTGKDDVTESVTGSIGVTKDSNYLTFSATGTEGEKPSYSVVAGTKF